MAAAPERRKLQFTDLDQVVADAESLLVKGYDRAGNWDLAQVSGHLANWMTYPVGGFPKSPLPIRVIMRMVRATMGRRLYEKTLRDGFGTGKPTIPESVPTAGGDATEAVVRLRAAAERFKGYSGEIVPSPLFGRMTKDEATRLQLVHAAHHLSFLVPKHG